MRCTDFFDIINTALAKNPEVILVLLDFDKVSHEMLTEELEALGFDNHLIKWVTSFLASRKQRVILGKVTSDWCQVLSGVPEGSVLRPLLFLIYINDMPELLSHHSIISVNFDSDFPCFFVFNGI